MYSGNFMKLFDQHAAMSYDKYKRLIEIVGNVPWSIELGEGLASFGDNRVFNVQALGTETAANLKWQWSWAQPNTPVPPRMLQACLKLKEYGEVNNVPEFCQPEISLRKINGIVLALIATGVLNYDTYYKGAYPGNSGGLFVLMESPLVREAEKRNAARIIQVTRELNAAFNMGQFRALESFLQQKQYKLLENNRDRIVAVSQSGEKIEADFNGGKLMQIRQVAE